MDQAVVPHEGAIYASIEANVPIGQEFVPSAPQHLGVRLFLDDRRGPSSDSVTVLIRADSIGGAILGSAEALPELDGGQGFVEFRFPEPVELVPGRTYVIEAVSSGERWWWMGVGAVEPGPYAPGHPISRGRVHDDPWDMVFETLVR